MAQTGRLTVGMQLQNSRDRLSLVLQNSVRIRKSIDCQQPRRIHSTKGRMGVGNERSDQTCVQQSFGLPSSKVICEDGQ